MQWEVVTSVDGLAALRDDWNALTEDDPLASWEWRASWWEAWGRRRRLRVAVVRQRGRLAGILPCCVETRPWSGRTLTLLGGGHACTDYQRVLLSRELSASERASAIELLVDGAVHGGESGSYVDCCDWDGVAEREPTMAAACDRLRAHGFTVLREPLESTWVTELGNSFDEFRARAPRGLRRKIQKAEARAEAGEAVLRSADSPAAIAAYWPHFVRLHQARFGDRAHGGGCFADPRFEIFLRAATERLAARRQARLVGCEVEGEPIAMQLLLTSPGAAAMYQSGFDPRYRHVEPGFLLYALSFRALIAEGIATFDFLRGNEPYKATWLAQPTPLTRLIAVAPRSSAQLRYYSWQWARLLKRSALATWRGGRGSALADSSVAPVPCALGVEESALAQSAARDG